MHFGLAILLVTTAVGVCRLDDARMPMEAEVLQAAPLKLDETLRCEWEEPPVLDCSDPLMSLLHMGPIGRCDMQKVGQPRTRLHAQGARHTSRGLLALLLSPGRGRYELQGATPLSQDSDHGARAFLPSRSLLFPRGDPSGSLVDPPEPPLQPGHPRRLLRPPR